MLSPAQFPNTPAKAPWTPDSDGPIRDLTQKQGTSKPRAAFNRADEYRSARLAYDLHMEKTALGYKTEEKEYKQENPPPSWKGFLKEGFH